MDLIVTTPLPPSGDRGDWEKVLAMAALGLGSFVAGMVPAFISNRNRSRFPLTTSLLLCFGAGVLLATALIHILPEVHEQMSSNFAEISFCGGFLLIYFIDEFIHYFFGEAIQHTHTGTPPPTTTTTEQPTTTNNSNRSYGSIPTETEPLLPSNGSDVPDVNIHDGHSHAPSQLDESTPHSHTSRNQRDSHLLGHCNSEAAIAEANARICHTSHTEPCEQTMIGTLGLFIALSLHSAIEGLAIGVQNSATKVLFLLGAVACHKYVMGFCLGLEFRSNPQTNLRSHFIGILIFALGAVCGIGLGMIIVDVPKGWAQSALPVIQALAGGTLLYVTVSEVIPREKARWHQNRVRKSAGFAQFFAVAVGFAAMCIINFYIKDDDT